MRIRFLSERTLSSERKELLEQAEEATFLPMAAIGEQGSLDTSLVRDVEDVKSGYTMFFDGDVVIAKITPCFENGKGALVRGTLNGIGFGTTELHVVSPGQELDARYLYYLTASPHFRRRGEAEMTGAAGQKRVPTDFVLDYRVPILDTAQQRVISQFLDAETTRIDALIAAKENVLAILAEKRRALITRAVTCGLDPDVTTRTSGIPWLGEIPTHWEVIRLKFLLEGIEQGWSPQCDNYPAGPDEWGVLKTGCVNGDAFDETENKRLPDDLEPPAEYEIHTGDLLLSRANTTALVGSAALVRDVRPRLLLCDKLYRLRVDQRRLDTEFLEMFFNTPVGRCEFERDATGASASMQNISQSAVRNLWMAVPPRDEQSQIVCATRIKLGQADAAVRATRQTVELLRERREAVISATVSGQLNVEAVRCA